MRAAVGLALLAWGLLSACDAGQRMLAGRGEYQLYRTSRTAPTVEQRLGAAHRYLRAHPAGQFQEDVQAWFAPAEQSYVQAAWNRMPALKAYLEALPDGPSAERVKARIEELDTATRLAEERRTEKAARAEALDTALERASDQRKEFVAEVNGWLSALAVIRTWRTPVATLPPAVAERLGGRVEDACLEDLCSKAFTPRFAIPVEGRLVPREASYAIEVVLEEGGVVGVRLRGRELMSRVAEALDKRPVSFADPQSRAEAIGRTLLVVSQAVEPAFPAETCEKPAVSPIVFERACQGSRVVATAAVQTGEDDVIAFGPEAPEPAAPTGGKAKDEPQAPKP